MIGKLIQKEGSSSYSAQSILSNPGVLISFMVCRRAHDSVTFISQRRLNKLDTFDKY